MVRKFEEVAYVLDFPKDNKIHNLFPCILSQEGNWIIS